MPRKKRPDIEEILKLVYEMMLSPKFPTIPEELEGVERLVEIAGYVQAFRDGAYGFAHGDLSCDLKGRGFLIGCFKELQANLRHLTWFAKRVASGDYDQQIEFMGDFSEYFNRMSRDFYEALKSLRESESNLLKITKELHKSEERWQLAIACTQDGVYDIDLNTKKAFFSPRAWEILRLPLVRSDIDYDPVTWGSFIHSDDLEKWAEVLNMSSGTKLTNGQGKHYFEFRVMAGDEKYRWLGVHHMAIVNAEDVPRRYVGTIEDIQEMREHDEEIRKQATLDQLTKLPNRYLYKDRLLQNMVMAKRNVTSLVLILWDLDGFKWVNDTYGHLAGDRLLVVVAELMRASLRETDTLARFGGDEFVMLITSYRGHEEEVANLTISRIFNTLCEPLDIGVEKVKIGASCGISFFPRHTNDGEILFNMADKALYEAKKTGKNKAVVWDSGKLGQQKTKPKRK
ncbi:MAG: diguanylate cyclase [Synergistaceae bacterium]|nr:diguanylate cyclase [Synergistaceae bacterium]